MTKFIYMNTCVQFICVEATASHCEMYHQHGICIE